MERLVEPYALSYKRAAAQPAREYFYAYDRTGGRSSASGIRSFLNKVQRFELTEEKFEPRYDRIVEGRRAVQQGPFWQKLFAAWNAASGSERLRAGSGAFPRLPSDLQGSVPVLPEAIYSDDVVGCAQSAQGA